MNEFICPGTGRTLRKDKDGNLWCVEGNQKYFYKNYAGSLDFVGACLGGQELSYYSNVYEHSDMEISKSLSFDRLRDFWYDEYIPWNTVLLNKLENLEDKTVVLLGNGISIKEFYFLSLGADLIYTDLSISAALRMKSTFRKSHLFERFKEKVNFHAVDALNLPFPDETVDIIYGYAFVHHLGDIHISGDENIDKFFSEVSRTIRKGGMCVFLDDAYSPVWQYIKKSILKPLQLYSHKKTGISPSDLRATQKGGYREEQVRMIARKYKFESYFFERSSFFLHLWSRGVMKLFNNETLMKRGSSCFRKVDTFLSRHLKIFRENEKVLVWGFKK